MNLKQVIKDIVADPQAHTADEHFGEFARELVLANCRGRGRHGRAWRPAAPAPIAYRTWGESGIDAESHVQMRQACALPMAAGAALMPDAHVGYGLPIGGVLALEGAVVPYAVGVDIACRMKLSVLDMPAGSLTIG